MTIDDLTLDTTQGIDIKADIGDVFRSVLHRFGEGFTKPPQGESMQMTLEQWPGGRPSRAPRARCVPSCRAWSSGR